MRRLVFAALLCLTPAAHAADLPRLPPRDESAQDPSFAAFREELLAAVRTRNLDRVAAMASEEVQLSFGDDSGRVSFRNEWLVEDVDPDYLQNLETLLSLGAVRIGEDSFCMPYTFCAKVDAPFDPFETLIVTAPKAKLRLQPEDDAPTVADLSYDVLRQLEPIGESALRGWERVARADGLIGYVRGDAVRHLLDYRMIVARENAGWRIDAIVAGD